MFRSQAKKIITSGVVITIIAGAAFYFMQPQDGMPYCYKTLVCDSANLLTPDQKIQMQEYHQALLEQYDIDLHVLTGGATPEQAVKIFKAANIGEKSKQRAGLLLLIDPQANMVRLEVSAGLDAVYTDGFVAYIQQRQMVPFFKANQVANGVLATTEMLVTRAQDAIAGKKFIPPEQLPQNLAIGAGAQTAANIGSGYRAKSSSSVFKTRDGMQPEDVVALYHKALEEGNSAYDLPIYAASTQDMKKTWVVTPAQMKNEFEAYKKCDIDKTIILKEKSLAVVRYKVDQRQCAPYFLRLEGGQWRLDFLTMMYNIKFNVSNEWHLDMNKPWPYGDAFLDWSFNKDGYAFPHTKMRWGIMTATDQERKVTYVKKIYPDTPAVNMALKENDIILNWDGMDEFDYRKIWYNMDGKEEGQVIKVVVMRDGQKLAVELKAPPKI